MNVTLPFASELMHRFTYLIHLATFLLSSHVSSHFASVSLLLPVSFSCLLFHHRHRSSFQSCFTLFNPLAFLTEHFLVYAIKTAQVTMSVITGLLHRLPGNMIRQVESTWLHSHNCSVTFKSNVSLFNSFSHAIVLVSWQFSSKCIVRINLILGHHTAERAIYRV